MKKIICLIIISITPIIKCLSQTSPLIFSPHINRSNELRFNSLLPSDTVSQSTLFFPVLNSKEASTFFNQKNLSIVKLTQISGDLNRGTITTEILSDILWIGRVSFGSTFSKSKNKADSVKIENLINGGNVYFNYSIPDIFYLSEDSSFNFVGLFSPKFSLTLPVLGEETDHINTNFDLAHEFQLSLMTKKKIFNFFAQCRIGYIFASKDLYSTLNVNEQKPFFLSQWSVGVNIQKTYSISFKGVAFAPEEIKKQFPLRLALTLTPQ